MGEEGKEEESGGGERMTDNDKNGIWMELMQEVKRQEGSIVTDEKKRWRMTEESEKEREREVER